MNRWNGKVAIVTGASSGIGEAIAEVLVKHGVKVAGLARRTDNLRQLATKLGKNFIPLQCDLRKESDILNAFKWVEKELGGPDILVNNAGVVVMKPVIDSQTEDYYKVIETNLIAPTICSREAIQSMIKRKVPGHIVNINSVIGHFAETCHMPVGMYGCSKYAITALGSELRHEIIAAKLNIKVTSVSPGLVATEMVRDRVPPNLGIPQLQAKDVADAVLYALGTPESVEIPEITIIPHGSVIGTPDLKKLKDY